MRQLLSSVILSLIFILTSCAKSATGYSSNAVYYWRTTLTLNDTERQFLADNDVKRIYMRYFDVDGYLDPIPRASIKFVDSIPDGTEVVPVVYITQDAIRVIGDNPGVFASKILKRVKAMSHSQNWPLKELQLDCDWTDSTHDDFFNLCSALRDSCNASGISLSSTIRLHQLTQTPPPVDSGVLMVYNTGSFMAEGAENSIFHPYDIEPYLADQRLANYKLPLDVAWPIYSWGVKFDKDGKFDGLLHNADFVNHPDVYKIGPNRYATDGYASLSGEYFSGTIRLEKPEYDHIMQMKQLIDRQLPGVHSNIIYHLDSIQTHNFSSNEIKNIFSRR